MAATRESWEELHGLIELGEEEAIREFLSSLDSKERVRAVSSLSGRDRDALLGLLEPQDAAQLIELLPEVQAVEVVEHLEPAVAAAIVHELASNEQADVVQALGRSAAEALLGELEGEEANRIRSLARYDLDEAGGLMVTEFLAYPESWTVGQVITDLRQNASRYRDLHVQYAYVVDDGGRITGVLILRELLLLPEDQLLGETVLRDPVTVRDDERLEDIEAFFDEHGFFGAPVVDRSGRLIGVLNRSDVEEAIGERSEGDYLKSQGIVGGEELRSMPLGLRSRRRLSWLSINIVLNFIAASVIAANQDVLEQVIVLAVFLPIISDMCGCSGNQAVAVSMRELSLGVSKPADIFRVLMKELALGAVNGVALGLLIGLVAGLWQWNLYLALVVGAAMATNTVVAVCIGGCVPLLLKGIGKDPALASGPILTTVTDMFGFFLVLTLAGLVVERLPSDSAEAPAEPPAAEVAPAEGGVGLGVLGRDGPIRAGFERRPGWADRLDLAFTRA